MDAPLPSTNSIFERIKTPLSFITFAIVMIILIVLVLIQIYGGKIEGVDKSITYTQDIQTSFIIIGFVFAILSILFLLLPNFKDIKIFIGKFFNILLLILYIIGLIIFFRDMPSNILSFYSFIIAPITFIIGFYLFYISMKNNPESRNFNINMERIKYTLLYFCFIVFALIFYTVDPGGYISTYFGPSLIVTLLLAIFGFLYLITLMTLPSLKPVPINPMVDQGFFKGISNIGLYSGIAFILFLIIVIIGILVYPGGFISGTENIGSVKTGIVSGITIQLIIIFVLWILFFGVMMYRGISKDQTGNIEKTLENYTGIAKQVFLLLFGLIFTGILIGWIVTGADHLYSKSGIISYILNLIVILVVLVFIFKMISGGTFYQKSPTYRLIVNVILYIPCIFVTIIDKLGLTSVKNSVTSSVTSSAIKNIKETPKSYYIILFVVVLGYIYYFFLGSQITTNIAKQGGTILINNPVYTNTENTLGTYDQLNKTDINQYDYKYAISFWTYLDSNNPSINSSLDKYTSILNYGGKPNVLYNASENTMIITMLNTSEDIAFNKKELDENGDIIIYKLTNVLLQKWNNIIFNYNGGTIDIFYNGKLVKSAINILPILSKDVLTIGTDNGVNGGICNVTYFNTDITAGQIYYLYNTVKNKSPPVATTSKESIVKDVLTGMGVKNPPSFVTTIPINIDITTLAKSVVTEPDELLNVGINPNKINTDYISPKWFFTANNDNYTGL